MGRDKGIPSALIAIGVLFIAYSFRYRIGTIMSPGVGFFPLVCATGLTGAALALFWKRDHSGENDHPQTGKGPGEKSLRNGKVRQIVGVLAAFAVLHGLLGFWVSIFGVMVLLQRIAGVSTWRWSVFGGGATVGIGYLVFEYWMSAFFPLGVFGSLIFH